MDVRKLACGFAVACIVVFGGRPAGAVGREVTARYTAEFTYQGQVLTCVLFGLSSYRVARPGRVIMNGTTGLDTFRSDPECLESLVERNAGVALSLFWQGEYLHNAYIREVDGFVSLEALTSDIPSIIEARHSATFTCEENPTDGCFFLFITSPK